MITDYFKEVLDKRAKDQHNTKQVSEKAKILNVPRSSRNIGHMISQKKIADLTNEVESN